MGKQQKLFPWFQKRCSDVASDEYKWQRPNTSVQALGARRAELLKLNLEDKPELREEWVLLIATMDVRLHKTMPHSPHPKLNSNSLISANSNSTVLNQQSPPIFRTTSSPSISVLTIPGEVANARSFLSEFVDDKSPASTPRSDGVLSIQRDTPRVISEDTLTAGMLPGTKPQIQFFRNADFLPAETTIKAKGRTRARSLSQPTPVIASVSTVSNNSCNDKLRPSSKALYSSNLTSTLPSTSSTSTSTLASTSSMRHNSLRNPTTVDERKSISRRDPTTVGERKYISRREPTPTPTKHRNNDASHPQRHPSATHPSTPQRHPSTPQRHPSTPQRHPSTPQRHPPRQNHVNSTTSSAAKQTPINRTPLHTKQQPRGSPRPATLTAKAKSVTTNSTFAKTKPVATKATTATRTSSNTTHTRALDTNRLHSPKNTTRTPIRTKSTPHSTNTTNTITYNMSENMSEKKSARPRMHAAPPPASDDSEIMNL